MNDADQIIVALQDGRVFEALLVGSDFLPIWRYLKLMPLAVYLPFRSMHVAYRTLATWYWRSVTRSSNLGQTITQGIISATGRIGLNPTGRQNFLQTDASINHGNSGGALVNSLGELMGINTLSFDKSNDGETPEGIGFAIPFQLATKIMDKLIRDGRVIRGYIGIGGREIAPLHAQGGGIDQLQGIVVNEVSPDGPAANAGIQVNDLIISVDNKPAISALETMDQVAEIRPGSVIPVVVMRDDKQLTLQVTIQEYPATNLVECSKQKTGVCAPVFYYSLINYLLTNSSPRATILQRIQHTFQCALFKCAQGTDRFTLFHAVFTQQQRLREETCVLTVAFNIGTFDNACPPCSARTRDRPKRAAAWPIDRVADPPPAFASTTSVPAFWIRLVRSATSCSVKLTPGTCDSSGRMVTPE